MDTLLSKIQKCTLCADHLPLGPRPVLAAHPEATLAIIGQAPGQKVHRSGVPWDDASGRLLREWLGITPAVFYDARKIALIPMGFCYPGKGNSGDLPPRPECAPQWHNELFNSMKHLQCCILIGNYAQRYYLKEGFKTNLTETVKSFGEYLPAFFPLPHPSPRNRFWMKKNPWFETTVLPELKRNVHKHLGMV